MKAQRNITFNMIYNLISINAFIINYNYILSHVTGHFITTWYSIKSLLSNT